MWPVLSRRWGPARAIRASQPLLATQSVPGIEPDPRVRRVQPADLPRFLPAAVSMFTEELGVSPIGPDAGRGYRARVAELIDAGRAFARFDEHGQVEFKAEIGVLGRATAQLQGVWVRPDLRRRGMATAAMAGVLRLRAGAGAVGEPVRQRLQPRRPPALRPARHAPGQHAEHGAVLTGGGLRVSGLW